jgi:hypothetical protein
MINTPLRKSMPLIVERPNDENDTVCEASLMTKGQQI